MLGELGVDNFGVFKCKLLGDRIMVWFAGGLLVDVFEDVEPVTAVLVGVVNRSLVTVRATLPPSMLFAD